MPYLITDGTSYCHRTRTRAVEIVSDASLATKFSDRTAAENLLARATKKLKGFQLVEIPDNAPAPAAEEKHSAPRKRGRRRKEAVQAETIDTGANAPEESTASQAEETGTAAAVQETAGESHQSAAEAKNSSRRGARRSQRRKKNPRQTAAEAVEVSEPVEVSGNAETDGIRETLEAAAADNHEAFEPADTAEPADVSGRAAAAGTADAAEPAVPAEPAAAAVAAAADETAGSAGAAREAQVSEPTITVQVHKSSPRNAQMPSRQTGTEPKKANAAGSAAKVPEKTVSSREAAKAATPDVDMARLAALIGEPKITMVTHSTSEVRTYRPSPARSARPETVPASEAEPVMEKAAAPEPLIERITLPKTETEEETPRNEQFSRRNNRRQRNRVQREQTAGTAEEDAKSLRQEASFQAEEISMDLPSAAPAGTGNPAVSGQTAPAASQEASRGKTDETRHQENASSGRRRASSSRSRTSRSGSSRRRSVSVSSTADDNRRRMFTPQERNLVYNRTEGHCGICGRFIPLEEYTIDHIIPLSKGGTNDLSNLQACCNFCNKAKDDSLGDDFFRRIQRIYLYQAKLRFGKKQMKKLKKAIKDLYADD